MSNEANELFGLVVIGVLILGVIGCCKVQQAKREAQAFENVTGKHVDWEDALWLELRVDGDGK